MFWETISDLDRLAGGRDLADLQQAAHSAIGAASYVGDVGAQTLGEHLEKLEALAAANDREKCEAQLAKVAAEFSRVEEFINAQGIAI
ncbi:MAG: hypothetical protein IH996_06760 [Proteobacteria bacterium]|nr:hypothetical protein [Pseudomonadota bacterium]